MSQGPLLDTNSPLNADQARQLNEALATLNANQMTWLSGYLAGMNASGAAAAPSTPVETSSTAVTEITVLYGSQTGNAEGVAELAADRARAHGFNVRVADMADFDKKDFKNVTNFMIVVSTQGEGEPPDTAQGFYELMYGRKAPKLDGVHFSVLALGDSSYEHFCQVGKNLDARFAELGAERIFDRQDCDVDYDEPAEAWIESVLDRYAELSGAGSNAAANAGMAMSGGAVPAETSQYSKKNPFQAEVLDAVVLNGRGSDKETRHIELSLEGSGLTYEPGDALGVVPQNDPAYVDSLIETLRMDAGHDLGEGKRLRDALLSEFEVTTLTRPFLEHWAEVSDAAELRRLLGEDARDELRDWLYGRHIIDVLEHFPVEGLDAQEFTRALRKLPPRLYSIASSLNANPDEVHLTVGIVRYEAHGRLRNGVTSTYLADRIQPGDNVPIYIDRNKNFKLPFDSNAPIIMVGPGTGVAPFRAFMQEREEMGAEGKNWLFFGDRRFRSDFLYQTEWLNWREKGLLNRLDVAFSRDQQEKVYVQDRMRENAHDIYAWLEEGAHFYVCGDGERMAADVHQALIDVVREQGGRSEDAAADYIRDLQKAKRYQRDVY
ncbi:assimilatory sulfite reductase (NADPH) flavoprotein subunit [Phytohalomonas tamaricis]|uniref:assimilatory sulfite reductase (NADPH) flavoprotein subunit n=1 Tax=Phytohalomonas tamaricis TaxID=2081032 RepID=UPI000D0BD61D|nr:assimilatory sulfite reductase (NADPH) flavoprotein subunit [Phytohalomonas tamaricis]